MSGYIRLKDFIASCRDGRVTELTSDERNMIRQNREILERLARQQPVYGFNTGVGDFWNRKIPPAKQSAFQENLLLTHAVGVGEYLSPEETRGMMLLLINMLRKGYSGISVETLEQLINLFNRNIIPAIPEQGSVGASGDLAPLAHLALVLIGRGDVLIDGKPVPTKYAFDLERGHISPIKLKSGEAIALINGTHFMTSVLAFSVWRSEILAKTADVVGALTMLALGANKGILDYRIQWLRPHFGQAIVARNLALLLGEGDVQSKALQDGYSIRCMPQIHGPVRAAVNYTKETVTREINSLTGNPLVVNDKVIYGGNFHGQNLSMAADFLSIALTVLTNISERRIERLLNRHLSGLPPFLSEKPGLDSGFMVAQYTAASLCSENKSLSHPASVDSIPLSAGQEDFVSMGAGAAIKARRICANAVKVLAIELLCAMRAMDLQETYSKNHPLFTVKNIIESKLNASWSESPKAVIDKMSQLVERGIVLEETEKIVGPLA